LGSMQHWDLEVARADFRAARVVEASPTGLGAGETLLVVERLALTANTMTYAALGDELNYWGLFPASPGFGRIPAWGHGVVVDSRQEKIALGERFFGVFPMSSHMTARARPTRLGFADEREHRLNHNPVYNQYFNVSGQTVAEMEDNALFRPLVIAAFVLNAHLREFEFFAAESLIITSASSKTALALAMLVEDAIPCLGATSAENVAFVQATGCYAETLAYPAARRLEPRKRCVIVDFTGDAGMVGELAARLGDALAHVCRVGQTHWQAAVHGPPPAGPQQVEFFFAPAHIQRLVKLRGAARFEDGLTDAIDRFAGRSRGWLNRAYADGRDGLAEAYRNLVSRRVDASKLVLARPNAFG
jgi:hypothetical protein